MVYSWSIRGLLAVDSWSMNGHAWSISGLSVAYSFSIKLMASCLFGCLVCLSQCKTRQNHQRQPESECQPDDVAEPLERPCQPELESQSAGAAGAAEPEYDAAGEEDTKNGKLQPTP